MWPTLLHRYHRRTCLFSKKRMLQIADVWISDFKVQGEFEDPKANPKHAQLIFTTHDTNLLGTTLGKAPLARDQVWLTEKDENGATVICPLTNYKPRKSDQRTSSAATCKDAMAASRSSVCLSR